MNRLHFRNINKVAAPLIGLIGLLASTAALAAGDKYYGVEFDDLHAQRYYDGDVRLWGELEGDSYGDDLEVQVRATVRVRDLCYDRYGRVAGKYTSDRYLTIWDYERIGSLYYTDKFSLDLDIDRRLGYDAYCPGGHYRAKRRVFVEHVHVRVLEGYGYGYGYDRDYDCHHQGYDCGYDYHGFEPDWGYGYGYGYGFGYDHGYYGYDDHDHGYGYGFGYYDDYDYGDHDYFRGYDYGAYDYGYDDPGYYDYDYGYVLATADCFFDYSSRRAYCDYY
jgi:hypothetical protein